MVTTVRRYTYQDLLDTPEDGQRYEIIAGELYVSASPATPHLWMQAKVPRWLGNYVDAHDLGEVFPAPVDVRLSPFDVVVPDFIFLRKDRLVLLDNRMVQGAPDLVCEILSPSTRGRDLRAKMNLYARAGVEEYWMIDPDPFDWSMYALTPDSSYDKIEPVDGVYQSRVVEGLEFDPYALFGDLPK